MPKRTTNHSKHAVKRQRDQMLRRLHGPLWDFPCDDSDDDDYPSVRCSAGDCDDDASTDDSSGVYIDDDDDESSSSDINDFIVDDIGTAVQPARVLKTAHMMDDAEKMAVLVTDTIAKYCGDKVEPLDRYILRFAEQPRALGETKISGLWKDLGLVTAVKECVYSRASLFDKPASCCPEDGNCGQSERCHLCHYLFEDKDCTLGVPQHLLFRGRVESLTPSTSVKEWRRVFDNMYNDESGVDHWVELGRDCMKLALQTHVAIHWYEHMCMRTVNAYEQLGRPDLSLEKRIALLSENERFINTELAIYYRAIDKVYDARYISDEDVQPWKYRGRTGCQV